MIRFKKRIRESKPAQTMFDRPFWRFFGALGDFFILTVYWIFTSMPLVTIGCSTSALFYVCLKKRRGEEGTLWKMYKKSFLENLKQGVFLWLLYVFIAADAAIIVSMLIRQGTVAAADFQEGGRYYAAMIAILLVYAAIMLYTAALLAMFRQTSSQCVSAAVGLAFSQLPSTLLFLLIVGALAWVTYFIFPALIFIDVPLAVYLISIRMNTIFNKQIERAEKRDAQK